MKNGFTLAEGAAHIDASNNGRRVAFTLAEVLITLGVIGVVAALTIPTLISKHQKKVYVTQFKKAYNTVTNAFKLMQAETGSDNLGDNDFITAIAVKSSSNEAEVTRLAKKYFNIAQDVKYYSQGSVVTEYRYLFVDGNATLNTFDYPSGYLLKTADGADIYLSSSSPYGDVYVSAYFDINGSNRAPNTVGRDFFRLSFGQEGKISSSLSHYYCTAGRSSSGHELNDCSARIIMDGFEMNY